MIYILYIIVISVIASYFLLLTHLQKHMRRQMRNLRRHYIIQISVALLHDDNNISLSIVAANRKQRLALAEALYTIIIHSYGTNMTTISLIAKENQLEESLLRRLKFASPTQRGLLWLQLNTILPSSRYTIPLHKELHNKNSLLRSCALIAILNTTPNESIKSIMALDYPLHPFDISRIIALLKRGILPLAINPLLQSDNHNLKRVALAIIRDFQLEIATKQLYFFINQSENALFIYDVIYTLCSLKDSLHSPCIRHQLKNISKPQRKALCRHLSTAGYSLHSIQGLFSGTEVEYAKKLITSYKRRLTNSAS